MCCSCRCSIFATCFRKIARSTDSTKRQPCSTCHECSWLHISTPQNPPCNKQWPMDRSHLRSQSIALLEPSCLHLRTPMVDDKQCSSPKTTRQSARRSWKPSRTIPHWNWRSSGLLIGPISAIHADSLRSFRANIGFAFPRGQSCKRKDINSNRQPIRCR